MSETKYIDHLDEDEPLKNQLWVCISFISPEGIKNCSIRGLKIRGVYATKPEADTRAKYLQGVDPYFHVFVGEMGKWLPWDPDPNSVEDQEYKNEELNDLMKGYKDNLEKSKTMQQERKQDMIKKAAKEEQQKIQNKDRNKSNKTRDRLRQKLAKKYQQEQEQQFSQPPKILTEEEQEQQFSQPPKILTGEEQEFEQMGGAIKEEEKLAKAERERLNALNKNINAKKQNVESIDDKLDKIKKLYEKLNSTK
jgi:hypothetical protein